MCAIALSGAIEAQKILLEIQNEVKNLTTQPHLVAVLVGNDAMSEIYVGIKKRKAEEIGMKATIVTFPSTIKEESLIESIHELNKDSSVHGILIQLPLPKHINSANVIENIQPNKDVDGINPINLGRLLIGNNDYLQPCTPSGCMYLIKSTGINLDGKTAVVIGRSIIVGKPMSIMLLNYNCTVNMAHSKTNNLENICKNADIIVSATGIPKLIKKSFVKPNAIVIDIGVSRVNNKIVGDVDPEVADVAGFLTPNPKGVGPMTVAYLMKNTLKAYKLQKNK